MYENYEPCVHCGQPTEVPDCLAAESSRYVWPDLFSGEWICKRGLCAWWSDRLHHDIYGDADRTVEQVAAEAVHYQFDTVQVSMSVLMGGDPGEQ